jgi:PAS domain-containing protein
MSIRKGREIEKSLDRLYETWASVREETMQRLGDETALHLIDFHGNNWIDITSWITTKYSREKQLTITFFQFVRLFKELHWLQFLLNHANYPVIYRNLRYVLEMMSQAWYVESKYPNLHLNGQIEQIVEIEEKIFGWKLVRTVFSQVLGIDDKDAEGRLKPTWTLLNKHVHSSAKQMNIVAEEDFSSLVTDSFNDNLARATLTVADEVFDLVYALIFRRFPHITELALKSEFINEWEEHLPCTIRTIKAIS